MLNMSLRVGSDGMGSWSREFMKPLLQRTFPNTTILFESTEVPDLVIRSHFAHQERANPYNCPYILWSGEARHVTPLGSHEPLFELNTFHSSRPNSIFFPHLIAEMKEIRRPEPNPTKKYCCSYAYSNPVLERELLFRRMRSLEPTCYSFGRCSFTSDIPFVANINERGKNAESFKEFAFNVAMENRVLPGYLTEKIGFAFRSGSVPIYWGDNDTVNDFFNPASFFNIRDYRTPVQAAETAVQLWKDPQKLQSYVDAPITVSKTLENYEAIYTEYRPWQKPMVDKLREAFPDFS